MSIKITPDKYPEIIETYNSEGKTAAYDLIRSRYGIKNPTCVMKRLKNDSTLGYEVEADRFVTVNKNEADIFMDLDALCGNRSEVTPIAEKQPVRDERINAMESMIHSLISDRLLELSRYVILDPISRRILVDKSSMQADGYQVLIN